VPPTPTPAGEVTLTCAGGVAVTSLGGAQYRVGCR
jgi:hypothetical protein